MASSRSYPRLRTFAGCLWLSLTIAACGVVVTAAFAAAVLQQLERESP